MKKISINFIKSENGIQSDQSLSEIVQTLGFGAYTLLLRQESNIRSLDQNAWYWCIMRYLAENTEYGYTKDEWHEMFSKHFLCESRLGPVGLIYEIVKSTTDLDTIEFTEYIEKILIFCKEELNIPRKYLLPKIKGLNPPF